MNDAGYRLARELPDVSDTVRTVPRPPTPPLDPPYAIRVAGPAEAPLVAEWMNRPHLAQAWEYDWPVARWRSHLEAQLAGTYSLPLIGSCNGEAAGISSRTGPQRIPLPRPMTATIRSGVARRHRGRVGSSTGDSGRCSYRASSRVSSARSRVVSRIMFDPDHRNTAAREAV